MLLPRLICLVPVQDEPYDSILECSKAQMQLVSASSFARFPPLCNYSGVGDFHPWPWVVLHSPIPQADFVHDPETEPKFVQQSNEK